MTADDTAPPIRLDRYIALLAILLAFVLGLLIISEQQRALDPNRIEGTVPPPEELLDRLARERQALLEEQTRLAEALAPTEQALRSVETEVGALAKEAARFRDLLGAEAIQSRELAQRVAEVEADRDRLTAKIDSMIASQDALAGRLAEIQSREAPAPGIESLPEPAAGGDQSIEPEPSAHPEDDQSSLPELLEAPAGDLADLLLHELDPRHRDELDRRELSHQRHRRVRRSYCGPIQRAPAGSNDHLRRRAANGGRRRRSLPCR